MFLRKSQILIGILRLRLRSEPVDRPLVHRPVGLLNVDAPQLAACVHVDLNHLVLHSAQQEAPRSGVVHHAVHVHHIVRSVSVDWNAPSVLRSEGCLMGEEAILAATYTRSNYSLKSSTSSIRK